VSSFLNHLAHFFITLGPFGLLLLGTLDSSFLFFPLGNDLLLVVLTTRHHNWMLLYALMATIGSVLGCFITDVVSRKGGEAGLKGRVKERQLKYVQRQLDKRAWFVLALASIMPPPFPFTVFVIVAAALRYSRVRLLGTIAVARLVRFLVEGALAVHFGPRILKMAQAPWVEGLVLFIVVISIGGSAWSIVTWIRRARSSRRV
jgi:membrane protein YqaA with SNARE-associated domain